LSRTATPSFSSRTSSSSANATCAGSGVEFLWPAMASTKDGASDVEYCRLGRKRQSPVSSSHVRASSREIAPIPFWRIRSARAASNCSDVKEEPLFQAGVTASTRRCCVLSGLTKNRRNSRVAIDKIFQLWIRRSFSTVHRVAVVPLGGGFTSLVGSFEAAFLLPFRFGGRPAGSLSKNTSKRLDVHAGNWLGVRSLQAPTIAIPYVRGQVGYSP